MTANPNQPALERPKSPLVEMLQIALPVVATMASFTTMQFFDKIMVSLIGPDPIYVGAQGNGGFISWVPISIAMGTLTIINTFVSQHLGAKSPEKGPAYFWAGLWLSLAYCLLILVPFALVLPWTFELARSSNIEPAELAKMIARDQMSVEYARVLLFGSVITLLARGIQQYFYGMHKPTVILIATVLGNITNLVLNTFFIYGPVAPTTDVSILNQWFTFAAGVSQTLGIPAMGVQGAAIATLCGTFVEAIIPFAFFLSPAFNRFYQTRHSWRPDFAKMKEVVRVGWPAGAMFGNEMICWGMFMVYQVGHFGTHHSTAGWIAHQWMALSFMPSYGISIAITSQVGKFIGMQRPDLAQQRAWLGLRVAVAYMSFCAIVFFLFRTQLIEIFIHKDTPAAEKEEIIRIGAGFLIATAAFQFFDGFAMSLNGALRGAGDTKWPGILTLVLSWTVIVGGGWAFVFLAPGLSSLGPWIAAAGYITLLSVAFLWRFVKGDWKKIQLIDRGPEPAH